MVIQILPAYTILNSSSRTKIEEAFRNFLTCFFVSSPSSSNTLRSMARSISSEKRLMRFQTLLRDVPPLNTKLSAQGKLNTICRIVVTLFCRKFCRNIRQKQIVCKKNALYASIWCISVIYRLNIELFVPSMSECNPLPQNLHSSQIID